jgi:hypothetical protein
MRKVMMVLATAVALTGALSADAFARGAPVGPLGQVFDGVNPVDHPYIFDRPGNASGYNAYGYVGVPHARPHQPAAQAARHAQHSNGSARSAYDYNSSGFSDYDYAQRVFGWDGGLYPFNLAPGSSRPIPLRSGDRCWGSLGNGNLGWIRC